MAFNPNFFAQLEGAQSLNTNQGFSYDEDFKEFSRIFGLTSSYDDIQAPLPSQDYGSSHDYRTSQDYNVSQDFNINQSFEDYEPFPASGSYQGSSTSPENYSSPEGYGTNFQVSQNYTTAQPLDQQADYKYAVELQSQEYAIPSKEAIPKGYGFNSTTKKTTVPEPEDDEHEIEYADGHDDHDEDYNDEASQDPGHSGNGGATKRQRKGTAGQKLTRWDPSKDQVILLAMETYIYGFNIEFDWDQVAKFVQYTLNQNVYVSGDAMKQHIEKMRKHREAVGQPCPPKIDRPFWGTLAGDSKEAKANRANILDQCVEASECKPSGGEIKSLDLLHIPNVNAMPSNKAGLLHLPMPKGKKAAAKQNPKQPAKPGSKKRKSKAMDIADEIEMDDTPSKKLTQATKKKAEPRRKKRTHRKDLPLSADILKAEAQQPGDQFALPEHVPAAHGGDAQAWLGADGLGDDLTWALNEDWEGQYGP